MGRYKKREPAHFGIDLFYAYLWRKNGYDGWIDYNTGREVIKSPLDTLSDNSTLFGYDNDTRIELMPEMSDKKFSRYFIVRDVLTNVSMAFICFGRANGAGGVERKDRIEVTGSGLILRPIRFWMKLIDDIGFEINGFKRIDICLDIKINTNWAIENVFLPYCLQYKKTHKPYYVNNTKVGTPQYTGLDIGEKNPKNTWKFTRVYNKIIDTEVKNKEFLYNLEEMGKDYTRVEIELRRDKCKNIDASFLEDFDAQYDVFAHEVFFLNSQFWKHVHKEEVKKYIESHVIDCFREQYSGKIRKRNLNEGEYRQKLIQKMERMQAFGTAFSSEKEVKKALATLLSYYKRLRGESRISKDDLYEMFSQIEIEISMQKEAKIVDFSD